MFRTHQKEKKSEIVKVNSESSDNAIEKIIILENEVKNGKC